MRKTKFNRMVLFAPGDHTTGGVELLHQLAHAMNARSIPASICYYPFDKKFEVPLVYKKYNLNVESFSDDPSTLYVIPETKTPLANLISRGGVAVWWMSVANYTREKNESLVKDKFHYFWDLLRGKRIGLSKMKQYIHFSQSEHSDKFLSNNGLAFFHLSDYLSEEHLNSSLPSPDFREDVIAYNPSKGKKTIEALKAKLSEIEFVAIRNMTPSQVSELLRKVKVFVDFGHHPGMDRPPREAVMAGCCVITNLKGSASNKVDVPIPGRYKIDETKSDFIVSFKRLVLDIFENFDQISSDFDHYRNIVLDQKNNFDLEIDQMVKVLFATKH